jgi:cytochrome c oxidase subunit 2
MHTLHSSPVFSKGENNLKRFAVPIFLTIVLSAVLIVLFMRLDLTPALASRQGGPIDMLLQALFVLAAVVFSLVISFLLYSVVVFRRRPGDMEDARPVHGNLTLEIVWTVVPLIIVLVLAGYGASVLLDISRAYAEEEMLVEITGAQFKWSFAYPEYGFTSSELVLPVNQPMLFRIRSVDVIHSFWIPEFRVKTDAIPGVLNEERVTPTRVGDYTAYCSELCGTAHAYMKAPVRVVEESAFREWAEEQKRAVQAQAVRAEQGQQLSQQSGCLGCHSTDGSVLMGPTFQGLFGSRRAFEDGTATIADEAYICNSTLNPGDQVVQGFSNIMSGDYGDRLTEEQIDAIIEFIKSLEQ